MPSVIVIASAIALFITFVIVLSDIKAATAQEIEWTEQFGSLGDDPATGVSVDSTGVYVAGQSDGTFFGETIIGGSAFIAKYDTNGNQVWLRQFSSTGTAHAEGVSVDSTGVYVAGIVDDGNFPGQTSSGGVDSFIAKYDTNGNQVWLRQFGTTGGDSAHNVSVDSTGVYVAGQTDGTFSGQTSSGDSDAFVAKYDTDGNQQWVRQFGTSCIDSINGVSVDSTGVYLAGQTCGTFPGQTNPAGWQPFVAKYDANGNQVWVRQFGSGFGSGVSSDSSGVYVLGRNGDIFIAKYDSNGNQQWLRQFGTTSGDFAYHGVSVDSSGVYVAGYTDGTFPGQISSGGRDSFVSKFDINGNQVWLKQFGTSDIDQAIADAVDSTGVYVAGATSGTFPGQTNAGGYDTFLTKVVPSDLLLTGTASTYTGNVPLSVTYTDSVTNMGDATLTDVSVSDSLCSPVSPESVSTLAPSASALFTCAHTFSSIGSFTNIAAATATNSTGGTVSVTSSTTVTVNAALAAPAITANPTTIIQTQSSSLSSSAVSTGTSPYTYQWQQKAPGAASFTNVGTNSPSYTFSTTAATVTGTYTFQLVVTDNTGATVTSNTVTVSVSAIGSLPLTAPTITANPTNIKQGQSSTLAATGVTGGTPPYHYQWQEKFDSGSFANVGTDSSTFTFATSTATSPGVYTFQVLVTDSAGAKVTSDSATVIVSFFVVPESPIGSAALIVSSIAALGGFMLFRYNRSKHNLHK